MPDVRPARRPITPIKLSSLPDPASPDLGLVCSTPSADLGPGRRSLAEEKMLCDRCGAEVYRLHAVWRCPACGFKSDCCGW